MWDAWVPEMDHGSIYSDGSYRALVHGSSQIHVSRKEQVVLDQWLEDTGASFELIGIMVREVEHGDMDEATDGCFLPTGDFCEHGCPSVTLALIGS